MDLKSKFEEILNEQPDKVSSKSIENTIEKKKQIKWEHIIMICLVLACIIITQHYFADTFAQQMLSKEVSKKTNAMKSVVVEDDDLGNEEEPVDPLFQPF